MKLSLLSTCKSHRGLSMRRTVTDKLQLHGCRHGTAICQAQGPWQPRTHLPAVPVNIQLSSREPCRAA